MKETKNTIILQITCPDQPGIIAQITDLILSAGGNILKLEQHVEDENFFFMRLEADMAAPAKIMDNFRTKLKTLEQKLHANISWRAGDYKPKVAILVGKEPHCLIDLLAKKESGELECIIPLVISNSSELEYLCKRHEIPFYYLPIAEGNESEQETAILKLLAQADIDLVVLARYMRILSPDFVALYPEGIINIHHSFLPAFKGARPYHQAWNRGVKIIGASAHYATADLDEGPIIAQDVTPVSHHDTVEDMIKVGRDIERRVLSEAVTAWLAYRIIVHDRRSVIFK